MKFFEWIKKKVWIKKDPHPPIRKEVVQDREDLEVLFPLSIIPYDEDVDLEAVRKHISYIYNQKLHECKQKNGDAYEK
jgi:hypothetical protein